MQCKNLWLSFALIVPSAACDLDALIVGDDPESQESPQKGSPEEPLPAEPTPSEPTVIVVGEGGPLAVDESWLFIASERGPLRVPKAGGEVVPVVPEGALIQPGVELLALDETHVYWSVNNGFDAGYPLFRAPKAGGAPTVLTEQIGPDWWVPAALVVDDAFVYLSQPNIYDGLSPADQLVGTVRRIPKEGGPAQDLASVYTYALAVDESFVYWTRRRVDGTCELVRAEKDGSAPQVLVTEPGVIDRLSARSGGVFWTLVDAGVHVARASIDGGAPITVATSADTFGTPAIAADAIYWLREGGAQTGGVLRATFDGVVTELAVAPASRTRPLFSGIWGARLTVDDDAVYWSYEGDQGGAPRVYRLAR